MRMTMWKMKVEDDEVGEDYEKDDKVAEEKVDDDGDDDDVAEDEVENDHVEDDDVKGEEDDDVEEEEEEDDEVEGEDRSQDCGPHFVRACAVEMHFITSQEPFFVRIYRENAADQDRGPSLRSRNALGRFTRATLHGNLQEKCPSPEPRRKLCASLHSRNALGDFTRAT